MCPMIVMSYEGINNANFHYILPFVYWLPILPKKRCKQCFIAGSATCSTKPLSNILIIILSKIKDVLKRYTDTIYYRNGVNQMWILKKWDKRVCLCFLNSGKFRCSNQFHMNTEQICHQWGTINTFWNTNSLLIYMTTRFHTCVFVNHFY